ncbi:MAG: DNA polymerase III subunit delta' [Planctomycetes bacterium]|nr:DNA polymerase III subunit delta' [Planctomycetota bacterium]
MSVWTGLRGHAVQREMFRRAVSRGRLSQSYLFVGPDGIGKQLFARRLANCLLCREPGDELEACGECASCRPFHAGNHPDFLFVDRPEGKRELPIDLIAGSPERRGQEGLCHDLSLRPLEGSRKIAIVNDADTMTEPGANAFLKTLEEPPERAMLLLVASNLDAVMPTIRSRCQLVRFSALSTTDVEELLIELGLVPSSEEARFAAALSEGSLTIARQLLRPELRELRTTLYTALSQGNFSGLSLAKSLLEVIDSISADTPEQRVHANWLIRFAVEYYRSALRGLSQHDRETDFGAIPMAQSWAGTLTNRAEPLELIGTLIERAIEGANHIEQNVPVPLALEAMLDDLARMSRPVIAR